MIRGMKSESRGFIRLYYDGEPHTCLNVILSAITVLSAGTRSSGGYAISPAKAAQPPLFEGVGHLLDNPSGNGGADRLLQSVIDAWPYLKPDLRKMIAGVAVMNAKRKG